MFGEHTTEQIINLVFDEDKKLDKALENLSRVIDEACDKYALEQNLNAQKEMDLPRKKEEPKEREKSEDNSIEIIIELKNYDEIIRKLEHIKKLLNEISNFHIEVK